MQNNLYEINSYDGIVWTPIVTDLLGPTGGLSINWTGTKWLAVGSSTDKIIYSYSYFLNGSILYFALSLNFNIVLWLIWTFYLARIFCNLLVYI